MTGSGLDGSPPSLDTVRSPVTRKLFRRAFVLYIGAAIVITGAFVAEAWLSVRGDLKRELTIYRRTLEEALAAPLWSLDGEAVAAIAKGMLELPDVAGVKVTDHSGRRVLAAVGDATRPATWLSDPIAVEFPVHYRHEVGSDVVGKVRVVSSPTALAERLWWRIALLLAAAVLKTTILWLIFQRVGRSILVRPLKRMTQAVRAAGEGRFEEVEFDAATAAAAAGTEIDAFRQNYNAMVAALRRTREEVAELNRSLEEQVADRTRTLADRTVELSAAVARLEQARQETAAALDAAERAGRAKSEFLALMSHELRTPLNSILGFSELLRDQIGTSRNRERLVEFAESVHASGGHLLALINDILDLSRIEAGQMQISPEWLDPAATARTVTELSRASATRKGLTLECRVDPSIGPLRADPRRFRQMLMNLLSNAVKFTDAPGAVTVEGRATPDGWLALSVADTGIGMRQRDVMLAMQPFAQIESPGTRAQQGSGLGLPLVARMARLHGGRLSVESSPGAGTTATIWFPPDSRRDPPASLRPEAGGAAAGR